ncbi:MAG: cytochrome P450, partial [Myxococcales bacterium]|nr:cytochrome P450 [Myxococcales bacterium]
MLSFDPFSERYFDDPFPIYARLRDKTPALYMEEYDCFFLSRFQDVW